MVKRLHFTVLVLACAACATVADLEVQRADGGASSSSGGTSDGSDSDEAGATPPVEAGIDAAPNPGTPVHACGCDAGSACCIRSSSAPACDVPSCNEQGALVVGCVRSTSDGRDCCWSPDAGTARSAFAAGCAADTVACIGNEDCVGHGGKCTTLSCKGVALGVCAAAAPSWFVCPP